MSKTFQTVIHLCRWYSPHVGGVETHVAAISQELHQRGWRVLVFTEQHDAHLPLCEKKGGIEIYRKSALESEKMKTWQWLWSQRQLLDQADVIHAHDVFWWLLPYYAARFFTAHKKIFITFHGWEGQYPVPFKNKLQRWVWSRISTGTMHVGEWIREFYWDKPDVVTYGGTELEKKDIPARRSKPLYSFVFCGRLSSENEITKYITLLNELKSNQVAFEMTWVGDGPLRGKCEEVGTVTGFVASPIQYLRNADIVFAASYLSILQAQSIGKVVGAFYSHPLKQRYLETFPGAKVMIITDQISEMEEKLLKLLFEDRQYEKLSQQAQKFAQQQTWDKVTNAYETLWKKSH